MSFSNIDLYLMIPFNRVTEDLLLYLNSEGLVDFTKQNFPIYYNSTSESSTINFSFVFGMDHRGVYEDYFFNLDDFKEACKTKIEILKKYPNYFYFLVTIKNKNPTKIKELLANFEKHKGIIPFTFNQTTLRFDSGETKLNEKIQNLFNKETIMPTNNIDNNNNNNTTAQIEQLLIELARKELTSMEIDKKIDAAIHEVIDSVKEKSISKHITIEKTINSVPVKGVAHSSLEKVLKIISIKEPVFLYGNAGSGKTNIAIQCAEILGLPYYSISVNEQTTKTDFLGYFDAHSNLIKTNFRKAFETGGVYIIDEIDAGNPNVLTVLNSALSNGSMAFPDGNVKKHEDFVCVCTANTTGDETDIKYIGRNILDAATLDRFIRVYIDYCDELESKILTSKTLAIRDSLRESYKKNDYDLFVSTRSLLQVDKLLVAGFDKREAVKLAINPPEAFLDLVSPIVVTSSNSLTSQKK